MAILPTVFLLLAADFGCRLWYGESLWSLGYNSIGARSEQERVIFREPLAQPDPTVGYACIPGVHRISLVKGWHRVDFRATVDSNGYRITHVMGNATGKPGLWIFGCSFTWGVGLDDEETFPWLVQSGMPGFEVRNLALNGYGSIQALLQLREAETQNQQLPKIAVLVYDNFHLPRNVAAASFLEMMRGTGESFNRPEVSVPAAFFDPRGSLGIRWAPLFHLTPVDPEPGIEYEVKVTQRILDEFLAICRRHAITPVFAIQSAPEGDPVLDYARKAGFIVTDIWVNLDERAGRLYRLYPVDPHPNARAHSLYAAKLLSILHRIERGEKG